MTSFLCNVTVNLLYTEHLYKRTVDHYELVYMTPFNPYLKDDELLDTVRLEINHRFPLRNLIFDRTLIESCFQNGPIQIVEIDNKKYHVVRYNINYYTPGA